MTFKDIAERLDKMIYNTPEELAFDLAEMFRSLGEEEDELVCKGCGNLLDDCECAN